MRAQFDTRSIKKRTRKDDEMQELNKLRDAAGLPLLVNEPRPCMRCKREFISEGRWHRLCWNCSQQSEGADL